MRFSTYLTSIVVIFSFMSCGRSVIVVDYEAQIDSLKRLIAEYKMQNKDPLYATFVFSPKDEYKYGDTIRLKVALGILDKNLNQAVILSDTSLYTLVNHTTDSISMGPNASGTEIFFVPKQKGKINFEGAIYFTPWGETKKYEFGKVFEVK